MELGEYVASRVDQILTNLQLKKMKCAKLENCVLWVCFKCDHHVLVSCLVFEIRSSTQCVVPPVAHSVLRAEDGAIGTEKRVHRSVLTNVPHLAAGFGVGVHSVGSAVAALEARLRDRAQHWPTLSSVFLAVSCRLGLLGRLLS